MSVTLHQIMRLTIPISVRQRLREIGVPEIEIAKLTEHDLMQLADEWGRALRAEADQIERAEYERLKAKFEPPREEPS